jgi:hypothetical protein
MAMTRWRAVEDPKWRILSRFPNGTRYHALRSPALLHPIIGSNAFVPFLASFKASFLLNSAIHDMPVNIFHQFHVLLG